MARVAVGDVYGRLTVMELVPNKKNPLAKCICTCGKTTLTQRGALKFGRAKSCGCLGLENRNKAITTHGKSNSDEYRVFSGIISRCRNPENKAYKNYGGRGIQCTYSSFEEFINDVGLRPSGTWIDRLDNDGNYGLGNCKWVAPSENQKNKRPSKFWVINGQLFETSIEAAKFLGVHPSIVIRGCNGYSRSGKNYAPRLGWLCAFKYGE